MDQMLQQLGNQLFWVLVIVIAGVMGAGVYRLGHRGNKTRMEALLGKDAPAKKASSPSQGKPKSKKKKKRK